MGVKKNKKFSLFVSDGGEIVVRASFLFCPRFKVRSKTSTAS